MKVLAILFFFLVAITVCSAQNTIGLPDIKNYPKDVYNAGTQNRDIVQDKNGIVYFANYEGLLSFDGSYWKNYPLPNHNVIISLIIGNDDKIYVGCLDEFGFFSPDKNGRLIYTSLKNQLPENNNSFSACWNIVAHGSDIFFCAREKIVRYNNKLLSVYPSDTGWLYLVECNNRLISQDSKYGLLEFRNGLWAPFARKNAMPANAIVSSIFPFGEDSSFISTINTGFFILHNNIISPFLFKGRNPFTRERVLTAIALTKDWIAIATNMDGVYIVNKAGEIIQNLSRKEGLQNNNILKLYLDNHKNLWLGLDNGIDFVTLNNDIKHIYPEKLNEGLGYTSIIFNNKLYVGTSNGLYVAGLTGKPDISLESGEFKAVPNTKGSTWGLSEINGKLLLSHHDGAFMINNDQVTPIDNKTTTYWQFLPYKDIQPSAMVLAGTAQGINVFGYKNNRFVKKGSLPGFTTSSQFIAVESSSTVWVAHPYYGVYKIDVTNMATPRIKLYTDKNGLPSKLKNHLYKIKNHVVITTEKGIYEYNHKTDRFEPSAYFKTIFDDRNIRYLNEDPSGNIWFIEDKNLGVVDLQDQAPKTIYIPELNGRMVADYEFIYPFNNSNVMVGAEKGFYHINYEEYKKSRYPLRVIVGQVFVSGRYDSLLFGGYFGEAGSLQKQPANNFYEISSKWNSIRFEYSTPLYDAQSSLKYSYFLKGFNKDWSVWNAKTEKEYTNLPAGDYEFQVRSKSNLGNESGITSYFFKVLPPWYQTGWAYLMYTILACGLICAVYFWQRKIFVDQQQKHEEEQKRQQYLLLLELDKSEKEIVKLKNEKLEVEIEHKNTQLASTAMHLLQKAELLGKIREEFVRIKNGVTKNGSEEEMKKILRILGKETRMDKEWEQFAVYFDNVHSDFLQNIKIIYPALTAHELKLCAYLRMNLSSKEIAQLENISVRGVELSRYRLRKKLKIPTETNLFDFLMNVQLRGQEPRPANGTAHYV
jgi:ligand-binding sensor domain-containing protein/DNA-binding CsgD family transcriptional regulator